MTKKLIFSFTKKDFELQFFRAGGPGGQNQNKRDSACRIIHKETGLSAESRTYRTQEQNKKEAFKKLCDKLVEYYIKKENKPRFEAGTEVIRTYNEHDDRIVDHRTGKKYSYKHTVGKGDMSEIIDDTNRSK